MRIYEFAEVLYCILEIHDQGLILKFLLRLALSIVLAFIIMRFFFRGASVIKVFVLAGIMFGLAYLFEYTKRRDKGDKNGI